MSMKCFLRRALISRVLHSIWSLLGRPMSSTSCEALREYLSSKIIIVGQRSGGCGASLPMKMGGSGSKNKTKNGQMGCWLLLRGAGNVIMSATEKRYPETDTTCLPQYQTIRISSIREIARNLNLIVAYGSLRMAVLIIPRWTWRR